MEGKDGCRDMQEKNKNDCVGMTKLQSSTHTHTKRKKKEDKRLLV